MTQQRDEVGNTRCIVQFSLSVDFCALGVIDFPSNFPAGSPTQGGGIWIADWQLGKSDFHIVRHHYSRIGYFYLVGRRLRVIEGGIFSMPSCLIKNGSLQISVTGSYNRFFMVLNRRCPIHMAGFHTKSSLRQEDEPTESNRSPHEDGEKPFRFRAAACIFCGGITKALWQTRGSIKALRVREPAIRRIIGGWRGGGARRRDWQRKIKRRDTKSECGEIKCGNKTTKQKHQTSSRTPEKIKRTERDQKKREGK